MLVTNEIYRSVGMLHTVFRDDYGDLFGHNKKLAGCSTINAGVITGYLTKTIIYFVIGVFFKSGNFQIVILVTDFNLFLCYQAKK